MKKPFVFLPCTSVSEQIIQALHSAEKTWIPPVGIAKTWFIVTSCWLEENQMDPNFSYLHAILSWILYAPTAKTTFRNTNIIFSQANKGTDFKITEDILYSPAAKENMKDI
jgi:hypothetical protein